MFLILILSKQTTIAQWEKLKKNNGEHDEPKQDIEESFKYTEDP